jgi:hypothetical protein
MEDANAHCLTFSEWVEDLLDTNIESVSVALDVVNIGKSSETHCHARNVGVNDARKSEIWRHDMCCETAVLCGSTSSSQ